MISKSLIKLILVIIKIRIIYVNLVIFENIIHFTAFEHLKCIQKTKIIIIIINKL